MERVLASDAAGYEGSAQGVVHDDRVYVQGTFGLESSAESVAYDAVGEHATGAVREQTDRAIDDLEAVLDAAGTSIDNVVKAVVYLDDKADFDAMNDVYAERFPEPYPARFAAEVDLPARVQIVAIAALDDTDAAVIETREAIDYDLPLSQGFTLNDTAYVQGMVGVSPERIDPDTGVVPMAELTERLETGIAAQTRTALHNVDNILGAVGDSLDDVVKTMVYLDDAEVFFEMNETYCDVLAPPRPARRCWEISSLFSGVEVVATAAHGGAERELISTPDALQYSSGGREYTSQGWVLGDTVYVHGMVGVPVEGLEEGVCPMEEIDDRLVEGAEAQARVALENGAAVLDAVGAGPEDVLTVGLYLDDRAEYPAVQRAYEAAFDAPYPVRHCYEAELFSAVEVELVARLPAEG
jgi:2-iminobutanoate/2-iminopropanoate deaminase